MNDLQIFRNEKFGEIRTVEINKEIYFVGKDVAEALGYINPRKALADHVAEDDKGVTKCDTLGGIQEMTIINESGLYALILGSKLETAKQFKRWVTSEILPSIRKHGMYAIDELIANPDMAIKALEALKEERARNKALTEENERMKPKEVFANAVQASNTSILVGDLAKILSQNGIETGRGRLFAWLRDNGYLVKKNGADYNMPTQKSMEMKLFEIKESVTNNPDGSIRINRTAKVTGKGQQYFINKFLA